MTIDLLRRMEELHRELDTEKRKSKLNTMIDELSELGLFDYLTNNGYDVSLSVSENAFIVVSCGSREIILEDVTADSTPYEVMKDVLACTFINGLTVGQVVAKLFGLPIVDISPENSIYGTIYTISSFVNSNKKVEVSMLPDEGYRLTVFEYEAMKLPLTRGIKGQLGKVTEERRYEFNALDDHDDPGVSLEEVVSRLQVELKGGK